MVTTIHALFRLNFELVNTIPHYDTGYNVVVEDFEVELKELIGKEFSIGNVRVKGVALHPLLKTKPSIEHMKNASSFKEVFEEKEALAVEVINAGTTYKNDQVTLN